MLARLSTSMAQLHGKVVCTCIYEQSMNRISLKKAGLDVYTKSPGAGHISANARPHQLQWGDREVRTATSCKKGS